MALNNIEGHYMILPRDAKEAQRLKVQHDYYLALSDGNLIPPSIPWEKIIRIADLGAGSGLWLQDVSEEAKKYPSSQKRQFDGFDISSSLFPSSKPGLHFEKRNFLEPFPDEHLGVYDMVHVSMMVVALKKHELDIAVRNIWTLLKPGGFIYWSDIDTSSHFCDPPSEKMSSLRQPIYDYHVRDGFAADCPHVVFELCKKLGFEGVSKQEYNLLQHPELRAKVKPHEIQLLRVLLPTALQRDGKADNMNTAVKMTEEAVSELVDFHEKGHVTIINFIHIVGRKPVE